MSGIYNYNILVYLTFRAGEPEPESELVGAVFFAPLIHLKKKPGAGAAKSMLLLYWLQKKKIVYLLIL